MKETLQVRDWLLREQKKLYRFHYVYGTQLAIRIKDEEPFYIGEDITRYGTPYKIIGWHRDMDVIKLSGFGTEFYTSINTISKTEEF